MILFENFTIGQIVWCGFTVFAIVTTIVGLVLIWYYSSRTAHGENKDLAERSKQVTDIETKASKFHKNNLKINDTLNHR